MGNHQAGGRLMTEPTVVEDRCDLLRSLHVPGIRLVLPNVWDVASARAW
jgi:hypothetical protein